MEPANRLKAFTRQALTALALIALSCDPGTGAQPSVDTEGVTERETQTEESDGGSTGAAATSEEVFDDFDRPDAEHLGQTPVGGRSWAPIEGIPEAALRGRALVAHHDGAKGERRFGAVKLDGFALGVGRVVLDASLGEQGVLRAQFGAASLRVESGHVVLDGGQGSLAQEASVQFDARFVLELEVTGDTITLWQGEREILGPMPLTLVGADVSLRVDADASVDVFAFIPADQPRQAEGSVGEGRGSLRQGGRRSTPTAHGGTFATPDGGGGGDGGDGGDSGAGGEGDPGDAAVADAPRVIPGAPTLDLTVPTTLYQMVGFLYEGSSPTQVGADLSVLTPSRISAVHGEVRDVWGQPLAGAEVFVRGKPEYGSTLTREDGTYDMVVAGGRRIDVVVASNTYLSAQRTIEIESGDSRKLDDVVLLQADVEATPILFVDPIEVHHSFTVNDGWPDRMTTLMFRGGTQATMVYADGTTDPLPSMTVRTTEFTVGEEGQVRMPAQLPPGTAYNYALEISADEAEDLGAVSVELDTPAALYVDNFRNFPVGGYMPNGSFDRIDGRWKPEPTGIVLEVLGVDGQGGAALDLTGDGSAADATALADYGITLEERQELAAIYSPGAELWRVEINHFTPFDVNPSDCPGGAPPPPGQKPDDDTPPNSCEGSGSIIEYESRVLGESLPLHGTPFSLEYRSSRVPGGPNRGIGLTLDDPDMPPGVTGVAMYVDVAGRRLSAVKDPTDDMHFEVQWDGLDGYGRPVQGSQPINLCLGYGFNVTAHVMSGGGGGGGGGASASAVTFGQWPVGAFQTEGGATGGTTQFVSCYGNGKAVAAAGAASISKADRFRLGGVDAASLSDGLGGWTIDVHHTLSRATSTLHRGDGHDRELANEAIMTVSRYAGIQDSPGIIEGPAAGVMMPSPTAIAVDPEGAVYVATPGLVRRIDPTTQLATVIAGTASVQPGGVTNGNGAVTGDGGDGGPATAALLNNITALATDADGGLYIADNDRLRYVSEDGVITTVAGGGVEGNPPAPISDPLSVWFRGIIDITVTPDEGGVLITSGTGTNTNFLRYMTPDGELVHLGGGAPPNYPNDDTGRFVPCTDVVCVEGSSDPFGVPWSHGYDWTPLLDAYYPEGTDVGEMNLSMFAIESSGRDFTSVAVAGDHRVMLAESGGSGSAGSRLRYFDGFRGGKTQTFRRKYHWIGEPEFPFSTNQNGLLIGDSPDDEEPALYAEHDPLDAISDMFERDGRVYYTTGVVGSATRGLFVATDDPGDPVQQLVGGGDEVSGYAQGDGIRLAKNVELGSLTRIARGPDGAIYVADRQRNVVLRVARTVPPMYSESWVASADGHEVYLFDDEGRHLETRDAKTHALIYTFGYNADGLLTSITDAFGEATTLQRDSQGVITGIESPDHHLTTMSVDSAGYLDLITDPSGAVTDLEHSPSGLLIRFGDSDTAQEFIYDARGRLETDREVIAYQPPSGALEEETIEQGLMSVASEGEGGGGLSQLVQHTTPEGRETFYGFQQDGAKYERRVTFPDGTANESVHEPDLDRVEYADGTVMTVQWSTDIRLGATTRVPESVQIQVPDPDEPSGFLVQTRTFEHTFEPRCTVFDEEPECEGPPPVDADLRADRITTTAQVDSLVWTEVYDRDHLEGAALVPATIVRTEPSGRVTTTTLNANGQVASAQVGTLAPVIYTYDARGRVTGVSQTDGIHTRSVAFGYDPTHGWLETVTSQGETTTFQRDALGRVLQQMLPDGEVVGFTYDEDGNVESVTPPSRPAHDFFYDSADRLREYAPPVVAGVSAPQTLYSYSPDDQVETMSLPTSSDMTFSYDATTGKLDAMVTPEATYSFTYDDEGGADDTGQLTSASIDPVAVGAATNTLTYTYDGGLLTGESLTGDVNGSVTWGYDDSFLRLDEEVAAGSAVAYGYDGQGRLSTVGAMTVTYVPDTGQLETTMVGDVVATYGYDDFGDLEGILYEDAGVAVYDLAYTRDAEGRIETKTETIGGATRIRCYEYHTADRLAAVFDAADSMGCTGTQLESYSYDANGNRSAVTNSAGTVAPSGITTDGQDRLLTHGDWTYTYNEDGQMETRTETSSGDVWAYTYDAVGNLLEVDPPGATGTVNYTIDPRNRRVGKNVDGVAQQFLYGNQLSPIAELDASGTSVSRFVYGGHAHVPDYMVRNGTTYRFLTDHLGSVVGVLNMTTGVLAQTREYDAYGRIVAESTPEAGFSQPFGFAGGLHDEDAGLVRFGARDYRPEVGSWAAKDPLRFAAGDTSLFGYCWGDPVNLVDPSGRAPIFPLPDRTWSPPPEPPRPELLLPPEGVAELKRMYPDSSVDWDSVIVQSPVPSWVPDVPDGGRPACFTLYETIYCEPEYLVCSEEATTMWRHEGTHVRQYFDRRVWFPLSYLYESMMKGYRGNRYEQEAYRRQGGR